MDIYDNNNGIVINNNNNIKKKKAAWSDEEVEMLKHLVSTTKTSNGIPMTKVMTKRTAANNQKMKE